MSAKLIIYILVSFLHDFFTAIWMGGMMVTLLAYMPAIKESLGPGPQTKKVMAAFQKKQSAWVYTSITGLIITGLLMNKRSPHFQHLFAVGNPYSVALTIKHVTVLVMVGISLYRVLVLGKRKGPSSPATEKLNARLLMINVILAALILLNSAILGALARPLPFQ